MTEEVRYEERLQVVMSTDDLQKLAELAEANTGENKSMMIRRLIALAWDKHRALGLHPPKVWPLVPSVGA